MIALELTLIITPLFGSFTLGALTSVDSKNSLACVGVKSRTFGSVAQPDSPSINPNPNKQAAPPRII
ncbi:MAG: hypothetical protein H7343_21060 [Undibacterium sp.]|nr:hypothetical protein [Opitutaceae bacterium]